MLKLAQRLRKLLDFSCWPLQRRMPRQMRMLYSLESGSLVSLGCLAVCLLLSLFHESQSPSFTPCRTKQVIRPKFWSSNDLCVYCFYGASVFCSCTCLSCLLAPLATVDCKAQHIMLFALGKKRRSSHHAVFRLSRWNAVYRLFEKPPIASQTNWRRGAGRSVLICCTNPRSIFAGLSLCCTLCVTPDISPVSKLDLWTAGLTWPAGVWPLVLVIRAETIWFLSLSCPNPRGTWVKN